MLCLCADILQTYPPMLFGCVRAGIAPEAKLSFFDIEDKQAAQQGTLVIPKGIEMFHAMYKQVWCPLQTLVILCLDCLKMQLRRVYTNRCGAPILLLSSV